MNEKEQAKIWLFSFLDSFRADLRIEGKIQLADKIRDKMKVIGIDAGDLPVSVLKNFRDKYRIYRNMPNASIAELEML